MSRSIRKLASLHVGIRSTSERWERIDSRRGDRRLTSKILRRYGRRACRCED